ncbi:MAG: prepilin-type N-terminal cleavage/methylation domain-containing protein [Deltaproteobacteria bacterium]|nr:prepilin-type N-terminal cleavage/methylation domain-containing protein [Deltaproteobacteria bacterium]
MKIIIFSNNIKKNNGGFTLIELVMTIILIGILSVGLYEVVMFGINDYLRNENYLHSSNSMTYAMSVIRRNLVNAATPTSLISPSVSAYCPLFESINPKTSGNPIVVANLAGQTTTCDGTGQPACNEAAFYQNVIVSGTAIQQLVVFCVNNNVLYKEVTNKEVTNSNGTTTSYPVANNIGSINF